MARRRSLLDLSPSSNAVRKGLLGGDRRWQAAFVAILVLRIGRKALVRDAETLTIERLQPGESVTIRTLPPEPKRRRRS